MVSVTEDRVDFVAKQLIRIGVFVIPIAFGSLLVPKITGASIGFEAPTRLAFTIGGAGILVFLIGVGLLFSDIGVESMHIEIKD